MTDQAGRAGEDERPGSEPTSGIPSFLHGGRVERTGIALVHEGEYVVPAEDSEAMVTHVGLPDAAGGVVTYEFPVRVEVVGDLTDAQMQAVARYVFDELDTELRSQA
jgi:hypothetical protein